MSDNLDSFEPLDRNSPMPLWAQLERELRRRLEAGEFVDRFPTDLEITSEYEVSRHTARHAVSRLGADGIVKRERGRGTTVNKNHFEQSLGALYSLFQLVEDNGDEQRSRVLAIETSADGMAAEQLGIDPKEELFHLSRLRMANGEPLAIDEVWMPADIGEALMGCDFTHTGLYAELARLNLPRPNQGFERIRPLVPSLECKHLLDLGPSDAAFSLERLGRCGNRPVEWRITTVRGDRFSFVAEWSEGQSSGLRLASD